MKEQVKINEIIQKYIHDYSDRYYIKNIDKITKQTKEMLKCCYLLSFNGEKAIFNDYNLITVEEGLSIIIEYLKLINIKMAENFNNLINEGNIKINNESNNDKNSRCNYVGEENNLRISIDINTDRWTFDTMKTLVHEFMHSVHFDLYINKSGKMLNKDFTEFFSIYYELDFLNFVRKKTGYDFAVPNLLNRYNDIISNLNKFYYISWLINEKLEKDVIDKYSNSLSENPIDEKVFEDIFKNVDQIEKELEVLKPHTFIGYLMGFPLAYCLSKKENCDMPKKVYEMMQEMGDIPLQEVFEKVGLDSNFLDSMNFAKIYEVIIDENLKCNQNKK